MCTSLAPLIGYDQAADIAKESFKTGETVPRSRLGAERKILTDADLDKALDPHPNDEATPHADMVGSGGDEM